LKGFGGESGRTGFLVGGQKFYVSKLSDPGETFARVEEGVFVHLVAY
jgi:hypothetical protein